MTEGELEFYELIHVAYDTAWSNTAWGKTAFGYAMDLVKFEVARRGYKSGPYYTVSLPISEVTTSVLDAWLATYDETPATHNRRLAAISKVFHVAKQRGYTGPVPYFPRKKEAAHRVRYLSDEEEKELLCTAYDYDLRAYELTILLLDTGMRLSEAYRLCMADLNWTTGMITIRQSKSGRPRSVPMTKRVKQLLNTADPKLPIKLNPQSFRNTWQKARAAMGMADDRCFVPHMLRHTCASRLVQGGVPIKFVQEWLGHASLDMTLRYAHIAPENLSAAVAVLEKHNDS